MSHLGIPTFRYIMQRSGRKPTACSCDRCKSQCHTPCLGITEDIKKLVDAGYQDRLTATSWLAGMLMGVIDTPIEMIQAKIENGWCTFYHDGLCELHDKGLKPTEGRLSHHSISIDNFNPKKSLAWLVAKEWLPLQKFQILRLYEDSKTLQEIQKALGGLVKPTNNNMKKYIGTKQVMAAPMTYGQAYKEGLIRENAYVDEYKERPGYLVEYADGYKSWSPADVFEEAYKVAETPLDRVNIEIADVMTRTNKLCDFIYNRNEGKDFQAMPLGTRAFLVAQHQTMGAYLNLLCLRQSCMEGGEECRPYGLSFEQVLPMIREGYAVRREIWGDNGKMVFKQVSAHITADIIPKMQSLPDEAKRLVLAAGDHIDYVSQCLIFDPGSSTANSWCPSVDDLFANDWQLVF